MKSRTTNWCGSLSERVLEDHAVAFEADEVLVQPELFAHRAALFYTQTASIPKRYVGSGRLDVTLPIATPDWTEAIELRSPKSPRFWVDLIQRQTMKLRWKPFQRARIVYTRYDYYEIRGDHFVAGTKALTDALKERTSGRTDGRWLYYFGAIVDDGPGYIEGEFKQRTIEHPKDARIRIEVDSMG